MINVDTDMIIPKQYLKTIKRTGLGKGLFSELRYKDDGSENPDFVLNKPAYRKAKILVAGDNFGCGSSREHAPWALMDFGIRCVISTAFGDIFYNNCFKNGVLPIRVSPRGPREAVRRRRARRQCHALDRSGETGNPRAGRRHDQIRDRRAPQALHAQRPRRHRPDQAEESKIDELRGKGQGGAAVGVKLAAVAALCALAAAPFAFAQKSTEDGVRDCEMLAAAKFKAENPALKKFAIARAEAQEDKFADKVGTQFVSTVYHGKALYQAGGEPTDVRFICLHGGFGKGAVFVSTCRAEPAASHATVM